MPTIAIIEKGYKQLIPYHFICNCCGEVSQKSYEFVGKVKASGYARHTDNVLNEALRQRDKQIRKEVRAMNRKIEKYCQKLAEGRNVTDWKIQRIPLNSKCEHCGKYQMWNPNVERDTGQKRMTPLAIIGSIGLIMLLLSLLVGMLSLFIAGPSIVQAVCAGVMLVGIVLYYINITIKERKDAAWFKANLADEPNDPDKLPQIDG